MLRTGLAVFALTIPTIAHAETELPAEEAPPTIDQVEVGPAPVVAGPSMAPVIAPAVIVAAPAKPHDLAKRIGVSGRVVSLGLSDNKTETQYGGGGIAASYRINRRWEVVVSLDALDAPEGPDLHSTTLAARFHLTPHRKWDWYAVAGLGALHEVPLEGQEDDHSDETARGRINLGVGLQRRWKSWSLGAEFNMVGVGPKEVDEVEVMPTGSTAAPAPTMAADDGLSGGELTIAATLFF